MSVRNNLSSPHDVLNGILEKSLPDAVLVKKPPQMFSIGQNKILALCDQILFFCRAFFKLTKEPNESFVFREFDNFAILYLLLPPRKGEVFFNVNHNFSKLSGRFVSRLIEWRYRLLFVDAPTSMLENWSKLVRVENHIVPAHHVWNGKDICLIVGNRQDQTSEFGSETIEKFIRRAEHSGFRVTVVGKNHPKGVWLSDEDYEKLVSISLCICLACYQNRHAGTIWYLKEKAPLVGFKNTNVAAQQLKGRDQVFPISDSEDLLGLLDKVNV